MGLEVKFLGKSLKELGGKDRGRNWGRNMKATSKLLMGKNHGLERKINSEGTDNEIARNRKRNIGRIC